MMKTPTITRSDLIELLVDKQPHLEHRDVELAVKAVLERMADGFEITLPSSSGWKKP